MARPLRHLARPRGAGIHPATAGNPNQSAYNREPGDDPAAPIHRRVFELPYNPPAGADKATREADRARNEAYASANIPPEVAGLVPEGKRTRFYRQMLQGKGPALARLAYLKAAGQALGYDKAQQALQQRTLSALSQGAATGHYLDPKYEEALRGAGRETVEGATGEMTRDETSRMAAAGLDPRSGIGADRAMQIQRSREQGLTGVERDIAGENYDRQRQLESEAAQEAGLSEGQRRYDVSFTEAQRQAKLGRNLSRLAGKALEPSGLEQAGGIVGGLVGGLSGR
jgi:hypothetical protein